MSGMEVIGRRQLLTRLAPLPVCTLLLAPHSTGKRTTALAACRTAGVADLDTIEVPRPYWVTQDGRRVAPAEADPGAVLSRVEPPLSVADVRELHEWASHAPRSGAGKVAVIRLGHSTERAAPGHARPTTWVASLRVQNMLLKLLEEPPPRTYFILTAVDGVLPTVVSRSVVLTAGLLPPDELAAVLDRVSDLSPEQCRHVAASGVGRVRPALAIASGSVDVELVRVRAALAALARSDVAALTVAASGWNEEATALLVVWAHECCTGRWRVFESADAVLPRPVAWQLAQRLSAWSGVRPRLLLVNLAGLVE